jgi:hypothetical protein
MSVIKSSAGMHGENPGVAPRVSRRCILQGKGSTPANEKWKRDGGATRFLIFDFSIQIKKWGNVCVFRMLIIL